MLITLLDILPNTQTNKIQNNDYTFKFSEISSSDTPDSLFKYLSVVKRSWNFSDQKKKEKEKRKKFERILRHSLRFRIASAFKVPPAWKLINRRTILLISELSGRKAFAVFARIREEISFRSNSASIHSFASSAFFFPACIYTGR